MGPSMSNPERFKHLNRQRHIQAYQKQCRTQVSLDSKIKLKKINNITSIENRETSQPKTIMIRDFKNSENQYKPPEIGRSADQYQLGYKEPQEVPNGDPKNQQNKVRFLLPETRNEKKSDQKNTDLKDQKWDYFNSESKNSTYRKIILNNRTYEIDIEKMKNRKLKSKQRYIKSILQSPKIITTVGRSNAKHSASINSIGNGISTLELQSQLSPFTEQNNIVSTQFHGEYELRKGFRSAYGKIMENRNVNNKQQEEVKAEYFDEYLGNFQSKGPLQYQNKVKKSFSSRKFLKADKIIKTQKTIPQIQKLSSEYDIRSEQKVKSKKSQNTASSNKSQAFYQNPVQNSEKEVKKTLKIIKIHKQQQPLSKVKLLN